MIYVRQKTKTYKKVRTAGEAGRTKNKQRFVLAKRVQSGQSKPRTMSAI